MRVIGITGMPGSGKSEAVAVARQKGCPVVRMGDLVWEEVERRGLPRDAAHVGQVANEMRSSHGKDIWSRRTAKRVLEVARDAPLVVIDGIRNMEEVATLRRELGEDFVLLAIHTDPEARFARMVRRARADDSVDEEVLRERDRRELGWGIARTIALADHVVVNRGELDAFHAAVGAALDELGAP